MKQGSIIALTILAAAVPALHAQTFSDSFSYADGALAGQGPWVQNSTVTTSPIQISGGKIVNFLTGQDVFANFSAPIPATDGTFAYFSLTLNLSAATTTGDYFAHFTNGLTNPTAFSGRLAAKTGTAAGSFVLGYSESTNAGTTFGTTDLTLGTEYQVILRYGFVAGALNDTGTIFVTPTSTPFSSIEANNTPYVTDAYNGTTAEIGQFTGFQFRQGGTSAPGVASMDNLIVSTNFAALVVPEPTVALSLVAGIGMIVGLRRRRK